MTTVSVTLSRDMMKFIEREIAAGSYGSTSDVVQDALQRMQDDRTPDPEKLRVLQHEIGIALDDVRAGRFSKKTVGDIADEVLQEFR